MSRRRSTGDLVPKDITEILAREARVQRGHRKPGSSLGHAFSWFKGSKRKKSVGNGINRNAAGVKDNKVGVHVQDLSKAGPKGIEEQKRLSVHYTASEHYQENVFIEGSRPQYLEDLHSEAQEGLKILQEEHRNGVSFPDDESTASVNTSQPEQDITSKEEDGCPESRSPTGNTDTSDCTAGSTRPGLTRQGSTFKPLNPVKSIDRNKKRSRRTTIMGIPSQVQKELALRHSTFQQLPESDKSDSQSGVVIIPTVDGGTPVAHKEGVRVHLSALEPVSREEKLLQKHLQAVYQDEQHFTFQGFGHHTGPCSMLRPKSVALPGMTSSLSSPSAMLSYLQEPQGPVMSISPQATYMSTIIPNAVLPASVEVIEIDHGLRRTRGSSVRTVSKSSLGSGESPVSPLLSRRSDVDGSQSDASQNNSTLISSSTSASNLSESQSSKTIVFVSSPSSSKRSTCSGYSQRLSVSGLSNQHEHPGDDLVSLHSSVSIISSPTSTSEGVVAGQCADMDMSLVTDDKKIKRRSLSVTKTKLPPAPPQRTNSLHSNKIKNSSKVFVQCQESVPEIENVALSTNDTKMTITLSTSTSVMENGGTPPKTDVNRDKIERTISPSSGYSSQSGTPTLSPKEFSPTSPEKQKKLPVKPERSGSRASSSPSSSLTSLSSGASEPVNHETSSKDSTISSALAIEIKGLLNIPSHPKVRAPCPPPPEIWAQNRRSVELMCTAYGDGCKVNQATQSQGGTLKQAGTQTEENELQEEDKTVKNEVALSEIKGYDGEAQTRTAAEEENLIEESSEEATRVQIIDGSKTIPVVTVTPTEERLSREPFEEEAKTCCNGVLQVDENHSDPKQNGLTPIDTLTIDIPTFPKESPPPTPPPAYHPTPPLSRKPPAPASSLPSVELQKVQEESHVLESCWPPPPPPMEETYEAGDEADFPLPPPPPLPADHLLEIPEKANKINLSNKCESGMQGPKQDILSQPVSNLNTALKKDTQPEILTDSAAVVDNSTSILPNSKQDCLKAEDPMPLPTHQTTESAPSAVTFRRQPSTATRGKEFQARHKSVPIPKEDANIPLVTPSLLQMVRLRSVSMAEEEGNVPSEEKSPNVETLTQENCPAVMQSPQSVPQKPIRKSLSVKSTSQLPSATVTQPSLRLQEAIRMKTAAMSTREGHLARPVARLPPYNSVGEGMDIHKSSASTASFIFSRSNKKVVIDFTGHSPEAQMTLKQNLAAELMQVSEQSKSRAFSNGGIKSVPPPVARKPSHGSVDPGKMDTGFKHQIAPLETKTTRVTADTIETLF